ncbi:MAG: M3 family oligoendopeptidase [Anaerolineae bacterium]|nr:M3 family oligoendopeptidase [Anaerolineae bacterium]
MFNTLPQNINDFMDWTWDQIKPYTDDLVNRPLTAATIDAWLADWSQLQSLIAETYSRMQIRTTTHTNDEAGQNRLAGYAEHVIPQVSEVEQELIKKLLASGLEPDQFENPLQKMRVDAEIFRSENLPLETELQKLSIELNKLAGARVVDWDGEEMTMQQVMAKLTDQDRATRERAWKLSMERVIQDRAAFDGLWVKLLDLRTQMAKNAGFEDYRAYRWQQLKRFAYTPDDCKTFHAAIEEVVVPAASRINAKQKALLGVDTLHPWDAYWFFRVDPADAPPLKPFASIAELNNKIEAIFTKVDPELGGYYRIMRDEGLLDLESRKHKSGGAYMEEFPTTGRPFIFANSVGIHNDVTTLLHEGGHAFHAFETAHLPYYHLFSLGNIPMEFVEVGSMAMELLAAPYLTTDHGGFYTDSEAARARAEHLEGILLFWPYMAVVDAFQHWIYENPDAARDTDQCDAQWSELMRRYLPDIAWSGVEDTLAIYWRRQGHIAEMPFYYVEYGLAQLGAVQVWANALNDQAQAVKDYRRALSLGATATLPELFAAAGAKFAFDAATLREYVDLIERTLDELAAV